MKSKNFTILIVEDEYNCKVALKNHLKNLGYFKIIEAKSSQEALDLCKTNNVLLAFLDIGLTDSELDGIELGKELNKVTDAAIIFTTSFTDNTTLNRSEEVDHQIYLPKPLRERDINVAIKKALRDKAKPKVLVRTTQHHCVFQNQDEEVYIKGNDKFYKKIHVHDIVYIKAGNGGVSVHTLDNGTLFTYTTLTSFLRQYYHPDILKIHNGHAINKRHISGKSESTVKMIEGTNTINWCEMERKDRRTLSHDQTKIVRILISEIN